MKTEMDIEQRGKIIEGMAEEFKLPLAPFTAMLGLFRNPGLGIASNRLPDGELVSEIRNNPELGVEMGRELIGSMMHSKKLLYKLIAYASLSGEHEKDGRSQQVLGKLSGRQQVKMTKAMLGQVLKNL